MMNNNVYAKTARFDSARALTEDELREKVPSIFATTAHESRSERFQPIPTIDILRGLMKEGFMPVGAKQSNVRDESKVDFTKHLIRLRRLDDDKTYRVGDTVCEILLKNANDGTSAYDLMAGLFRIACLNSLVTQSETLDSVKVRHSGDVMDKVIDGTYRVLEEAHKALAAPADWGNIRLQKEEQLLLADAAHIIRFGDAEGNVKTAIKPEQLLVPKRTADTGNDLWSTFNVLQENAIRGGMRAWGRDANNRPRRTTARAVNGIEQDVKVNKALWMVAERMAEIKSAA